MTSAVEVRSLNDEELASRLPAQQAEDVPEDVIVYTVDGPFFFGAIEQFESALLHTDTDPRAIVLKLVNVPFIDLTGLVALKDAVEALGKRGVIVALCCANADVAARLERVHVVSGVPVPPTASLSEAVQAVTVLLAS
jgi:SulP family sulfate permease